MPDFLKNFFTAKYLALQILVALTLAGLVGWIATEETAIFGIQLTAILKFFGGLFVSALKMIVVPLILSAIVIGVTSMASQDSFGRIGTKTVGLYIVTGFLAIFTGLILVNLIAPGNIDPDQATVLVENIEGSADAESIAARTEGRDMGDLADIVSRAIPENIFAALGNNSGLLAIIFVGVIVGCFMSRLTGTSRETMDNLWQGIYDIMIMITMWIIRFAPIGVFALVTNVVIAAGLEIFENLGWFTLTVLLALVIHYFVWLPGLLYLGKINPIAYYGKVVKAQLMAFSTASSSATLPVTMESAEKAGVSNKVTSFVLPLGATVNMDGTALYECVVVIFIAQIYAVYAAANGIPFDFTLVDQIVVVILALLTSIGVAGIPAASLVAITLILIYLKLPADWLAIILAVDRILDMCRTSTNVTSDLTITALVARSEGEELPEVRAA